MQPFWPLHWISCLMKHVTKALLVVGLCLTSNKINLFDVLHWTPYTMVLQPPPVLYFPGKLIFLPVLYRAFLEWRKSFTLLLTMSIYYLEQIMMLVAHFESWRHIKKAWLKQTHILPFVNERNINVRQLILTSWSALLSNKIVGAIATI